MSNIYENQDKTYDIFLDDGYSLELDAIQGAFGIKVIYQFYNDDGKRAKLFTDNKDPREISSISKIGKELIKHTQDHVLPKDLEKRYENILIEMSDLVENIIIAKNDADETEKRCEEGVKKDQIKQGTETLNVTDSPLLWIANEVDWYTAGERLNILYAWIAYCSQVILKNPISIIAIGEGASGKTHIVETALSMIPDEYVITIKSTTDAALFGFCDDNPYYFDGKIVNIGDMGGKDDHEEAQNFKNAMKELQSDGYMARIKQVPRADGGFENHTYELYGYPCLTYTNVPGHDFDDQEQSRSIFLTPRMDNNQSYMVFKRLNKQKNTKSSRLIQSHRNNISVIKNMVLALRERMKEVEIYNPYWSFIEQFLSSTRFIKRDVDKYDGILRVITCLNGYNREIYQDKDGNKTLFTTKDDISIFMDLLERYYESITVNLSPAASDLLDDLRKHEDLWELNGDGMTINEYIENSETKLSKQSIRQYFRELNNQSLVKVINKVQNSNVYVLSDMDESLMKREVELNDLDVRVLEFNYNINDLSIYEGGVPLDTPLGNVLSNPNAPLWNRYLPEAVQKGAGIGKQRTLALTDEDVDIDLDEEFDGF
jgi:hypothetical protein